MLNDDRRRALEMAAYGQTASAEESAAARRELERLPAPVAEARPVDGEVPAEPAPIEPVQDPAPSPRRVSRRLFVAGLATMLVVGLVGGAFLEMALRPAGTTGSSSTAGQLPADPSATGRSTHFDSNPEDSAAAQESILAAEDLLAQPAAKDDGYPTSGGANVTYVPSTTRLVASTPAKTRIWIARAAGTAGGYCLLSLDGSKRPDANLGLASCSLPADFVKSGVVLSVDGYDVTWKGGRITVAVGN